MKFFNANIFYDNKFIKGSISFDNTILKVKENNDGGDKDLEGLYIVPGLVDIHSHGAVGEDASDGNAQGLVKMSKYYAKGGVTSWCPTTMTLDEDELKKALKIIKDYIRPDDGAKICGINAEGPFISKAKCGAQDPSKAIEPDVELFNRLMDYSNGMIKLTTLACEEPKSGEFIDSVKDKCLVSLGHTIANYETAKNAFSRGANHVTHLFNAMPSLLHRDPGVIAAAYEKGATAELICDGIHVHPAMVRLAFDMFKDKLCLISDSARCAGMPEGDYTLGGLDITMKNGKATLKGTDTIAGSAIHLMDGVKRAISFGIPMETAIYAATYAPAKAIGMEKELGALDEGKAADFLITDKDLNIKSVYIDGKPAYERI